MSWPRWCRCRNGRGQTPTGGRWAGPCGAPTAGPAAPPGGWAVVLAGALGARGAWSRRPGALCFGPALLQHRGLRGADEWPHSVAFVPITARALRWPPPRGGVPAGGDLLFGLPRCVDGTAAPVPLPPNQSLLRVWAGSAQGAAGPPNAFSPGCPSLHPASPAGHVLAGGHHCPVIAAAVQGGGRVRKGGPGDLRTPAYRAPSSLATSLRAHGGSPTPQRPGQPCGPEDGFEPGTSGSGVRGTTAEFRGLLCRGMG